ncbi:MAG: RtcB family protein [Planctomycetota bacterium]
MQPKDLIELGIPRGEAMKRAFVAVAVMAGEGLDVSAMRERLHKAAKGEWDAEGLSEPVVEALEAVASAMEEAVYMPRAEPAPWRVWGEGLEAEAVKQMARACELPVAVRGALMPDAHLGYGLPIGGVLATRGAVIPYAVGVDIACRMKLSVLDVPVRNLEKSTGRERLSAAIEEETRFGVGARFERRREHAVMDADWSVSPVTASRKDKAWSQLGTSGSGNHFVEFGVLTVSDTAQQASPAAGLGGVGPGDGGLGLEAGEYVALLSHSGSRGAGAAVCGHYSKLARAACPGLPKDLEHLAWLDLAGEAGAEYWAAMSLMGEYAAANHACIHDAVAEHLGAEVLAGVENHHNFAWREEHDGEEVVVHRKGATPAGEGVLGVIPGSMASPGYVVVGKDGEESLRSASHGAGRVMSRRAASKKFRWPEVEKQLKAAGVTLLSAGLDEVPGVYKDIETVMAAQRDLVGVVARFDPKLVKMAPPGERAED